MLSSPASRAAKVTAVSSGRFQYPRVTLGDEIQIFETPKDQVPLVARYASDATPVPGCAKDAKDCEWKCEVGADDKRELKQIATVGEFVQFCVQPAMEKRTTPPALEVADAQQP